MAGEKDVWHIGVEEVGSWLITNQTSYCSGGGGRWVSVPNSFSFASLVCLKGKCSARRNHWRGSFLAVLDHDRSQPHHPPVRRNIMATCPVLDQSQFSCQNSSDQSGGGGFTRTVAVCCGFKNMFESLKKCVRNVIFSLRIHAFSFL